MKDDLLPTRFQSWFASKGWSARTHQLELARKAAEGQSVLLIAPTGAGKTLAGFLPSLIDLTERGRRRPGSADRLKGLHTLYVSPLKALAVDIARNLEAPIREMDLPITLETRTGDTSAHKRRRQKLTPPDILLTTPEQVALLLASREAKQMFKGLKTIILDELHSLVLSKRGDLLALDIARLRRMAPELQTIGLSATVARPDDLRAYLVPQRQSADRELSEFVQVTEGTEPIIDILDSVERVPWSGHSARYSLGEIYDAIDRHRMTLIFVNTRSQAEFIFQDLWHHNELNLPIALHHGSLDAGQRRKVEAAMVAGKLRAVVCTSTLDLGIDWGDVDLVINVGAPKGASRLAQRIGRANHRMDEPSKALLVPANRFEVMECQAALEASKEGAQDTPPLRSGGLDVLAQHVWGMACGEPFDAEELFEEVVTAEPYAALDWETFEKVVDFVATGGYALRTYERYARLKRTPEGRWRIAHPKLAQQYRLNVGTIVEAPLLKVRLIKPGGKRRGPVGRGGRILGEIEEWFIEQLRPSDTFVFAGEILKFEGLRENEVFASRTTSDAPTVPSYQGGKFPLSTYLAERVRKLIAHPELWGKLPPQVSEWLRIQAWKSVLPRPDGLLVETFPRGSRHYMVCYPFEGRLAHQTLGMLLTRRLERMRARPMGFVASEYALAVWGLGDMGLLIERGRLSLDELFHEDMLGDDLDAWLAESSLMKRTFRTCAVIAGLIERRYPGKEKTGRQITVSSDLIYDVLRDHEPDHVLLQATWNDAASGLLDLARLNGLLQRVKGRIRHQYLDRVSPLAVPVMLEIGREPVYGEAQDSLMAEAEEDLVKEAMGDYAPEGSARDGADGADGKLDHAQPRLL